MRKTSIYVNKSGGRGQRAEDQLDAPKFKIQQKAGGSYGGGKTIAIPSIHAFKMS